METKTNQPAEKSVAGKWRGHNADKFLQTNYCQDHDGKMISVNNGFAIQSGSLNLPVFNLLVLDFFAAHFFARPSSRLLVPFRGHPHPCHPRNPWSNFPAALLVPFVYFVVNRKSKIKNPK